MEGTQDNVPLGPEPPPPDVPLAAVEEDGTVVDVKLADEVVLGAVEEAELLAGEVVATAELLEGVEVVDDDPLTGAVTDTLDPVANSPQSLPAQEMP